jgi:hypothetical protein
LLSTAKLDNILRATIKLSLIFNQRFKLALYKLRTNKSLPKKPVLSVDNYNENYSKRENFTSTGFIFGSHYPLTKTTSEATIKKKPSGLKYEADIFVRVLKAAILRPVFRLLKSHVKSAKSPVLSNNSVVNAKKDSTTA